MTFRTFHVHFAISDRHLSRLAKVVSKTLETINRSNTLHQPRGSLLLMKVTTTPTIDRGSIVSIMFCPSRKWYWSTGVVAHQVYDHGDHQRLLSWLLRCQTDYLKGKR